MEIKQALIDSVTGAYIETYIRKQGITQDDGNKGQDTLYWVNELLEKKELDVNKFQEFLFEELFWGKRKAIRFYKIDNIRKIKYLEDWKDPLVEKYGIESLDFINILEQQNIPENEKRIVAIKHSSNEKGELTNIKLLYCYGGRTSDYEKTTLSYVPVEIDFKQKIMTLKVWNRNGIVESERSGDVVGNTYSDLISTFKVKTASFGFSGKETLYTMSLGLIKDIYTKVPNYNLIENLKNATDMYIKEIHRELKLENLEERNGELVIKRGVIDIEDELKNQIEKIVISDYFFNRSYENIWKMGVDSIIARIRFNDKEHVLTSMSGDNSERPIFCTKTFLALKKSLEDASVVERLWIETKRENGRLRIKYDASCGEYLEILILSNIRFKERDLKLAWEMYKKYE